MKRRKTAAKETADLLVELVDHLDAMVAYWNADRVCVFANAAYQAWFGKAPGELVGMTMQQLLGPIYEKNLPYIDAAYRGSKQVFERDIPGPDGRIRHSLATYVPHVVDGAVRGIFVHVADVGPLKQLERELKEAKEKAEQLATHDFLTGLPNRALLKGSIDHALALTRRAADTMAVMSIDIDFFKSVNDRYGHGEGDRLLIEIASRLRSALRESDILLRLAGDEFVVVATSLASGDAAVALATRILESVRRPIVIDATPVKPSVSIGIALFPMQGTSAEALIAASDAALYAAKSAGRDRWALAG